MYVFVNCDSVYVFVSCDSLYFLTVTVCMSLLTVTVCMYLLTVTVCMYLLTDSVYVCVSQKESSFTAEVKAKPQYHKFLIGRGGANIRKVWCHSTAFVQGFQISGSVYVIRLEKRFVFKRFCPKKYKHLQILFTTVRAAHFL